MLVNGLATHTVESGPFRGVRWAVPYDGNLSHLYSAEMVVLTAEPCTWPKGRVWADSATLLTISALTPETFVESFLDILGRSSPQYTYVCSASHLVFSDVRALFNSWT